VLAGTRAIWSEDDEGAHYTASYEQYTAALGDRRVRRLGISAYAFWDEAVSVEYGADASTLVYAWASKDVADETCDDDLDTSDCRYAVRGGGVRRIVGGREIDIGGAPPSVSAAASGERIALVPVDPAETTSADQLSAAPGGEVQVLNVRTKTIVSRFAPAGTVREVALTQTIAAVLVSDASGLQVARYRVRDGALLGSTRVERSAHGLDAEGPTVVYRAGLSIWAIQASSGAKRRLWTTRGGAIDVSIEGRRVVWGTNGRGGGRVLALRLPR